MFMQSVKLVMSFWRVARLSTMLAKGESWVLQDTPLRPGTA
jgi:hypothetical protein